MHALNTLNDPTYVEAARALAARVLSSAKTLQERLDLASTRVLGRPPSAEEFPIWEQTLARSRAAFQRTPGAAAEFLSHGSSKANEALEPTEHAAWAALCLNLLNLDEALTKE